MKYLILFLMWQGVFTQRMVPIEFSEVMGQCEDLMCGISFTCEFGNATCFGRPCQNMACVPIITKPGICPRPPPVTLRLNCDNLAEYLPSCYEDNHCSGTQRCCPGRCLFKECQDVNLPKPQRPPVIRPDPPTTPAVLLLAGGGRPRQELIDQALDRSAKLFVKDGNCPPPKPQWYSGLCRLLSGNLSPCTVDIDCSGDRKCCPGRCKLKECAMAVFTNRTIAAPPVDRGNKITIPKSFVPAPTRIVTPVRTTTAAMTTAKANTTPVPMPKIRPAIVMPKVFTEKPGTCPARDENWRPFCLNLKPQIKSCLVDTNCPEVQKCCPGRCDLKECKTPIITRIGPSSGFWREPALGITTNVTARLPGTNPRSPKVASCPRVPSASTSNAGQLELVDLFVCSLMFANKPVCISNSECLGVKMCCKTRCTDFRCQDPVYT